MSDILNFQVKDETLNNIISNNPFYVDIKGSVNICLIRCGQQIESCNSVNFSTMTNYGKMLVLNKNTSSSTTCAIKLAFDNSNDNISDNGSSNYQFETVFFTVPSLHKLNGVVYDMETFVVFSSVQKNGNVLYVVLCSLSSGADSVKSGDWRLLNYTLMNELFSKNNTVPDMYGTTQISGAPNPVDLNSFIPTLGNRNFYDYTHPSNTSVNFRVFQNQLSVPNNILTLLQSKLTPGNTYTNFKSAISQTINPSEGLFFYFSEDLTDRYKSFEANVPKIETQIEENNETIPDEAENEAKFTKLETSEVKEETSSENIFNEDDKKENFKAEDNRLSNSSLLWLIYIVSYILVTNLLFSGSIISGFTGNYLFGSKIYKNTELTESDIINFANDLRLNIIIQKVLATKYKIGIVIILLVVFVIFSIILLYFSIKSNSAYNNLYNTFIFFFILIGAIGVLLYYYYIKYLYFRFIGMADDQFSLKEEYLFENNIRKMSIKNIFFEKFDGMNTIQTGGDPFMVPAPENDELEEKINQQKDELLKNANTFSFSKLGVIAQNPLIQEKLKENNTLSLMKLGPILFILSVIFLLYGFLFQLKFLNISDKNGINFLTMLVTNIYVYIPLIVIIFGALYFIKGSKMNFIVTGILLFISLIIQTFVTPFTNTVGKNMANNGGFWTAFCFVFIAMFYSLINIAIASTSYLKDMFDKIKSALGFGDGSSSSELSEEEKDFLLLKEKYDKLREEKLLLQKELNTIEDKDEKLEELRTDTLLKNEEIKRIKEKDLLLEEEINRIKKLGTVGDSKLLDQIKKLESDSLLKNQSIEEKEDYINHLLESIAELATESDKKNQTIEGLHSTKQSNNERAKELDEQIQQLENQMRQLSSDSQYKNQKAQQLEEQIQQLENQIRQLSSDSESKNRNAEARTQQIQQLQNKIRELSSESQSKNQTIEGLQKITAERLQRSAKVQQELEQRAIDLQGELNRKQQSSSEIAKQLEDLRRTKESNNESARELGERARELDKQIQQLRDQLSRKNVELSNKNRKIQKGKEHISKILTKGQELEELLAHTKNSLKQSEKNKYQSNLHYLDTFTKILGELDSIATSTASINSRIHNLERLRHLNRATEGEIERSNLTRNIKDQYSNILTMLYEKINEIGQRLEREKNNEQGEGNDDSS
jgi:carbonic anhydrase/predicted  nucleic acid-binding Zn-ribbon protein